MRSASRIFAIVVLALSAWAASAETIPNWPVPKSSAFGRTAYADIAPGPVVFVAVDPCRHIDTRISQAFPAPWGPPSMTGGHAQRSFTITGRCGIPVGATAVSFNFAVWAPVTRGDIRVFPAGMPTPTVASLTWEANIQALSNAAIVPLGAAGDITVQVDGPGTIDLIADVNGYYIGGGNDIASGERFWISGSFAGMGMIKGTNTAASGFGGYFEATGGGSAIGVVGRAIGGSGASYGVDGSTTSSSNSSAGVHGSAGAGYGVYGTSTSGTGVYGTGSAGIGVQGNSLSNYGIYGTSSSSHAVKGLAAGALGNGVWAESTLWDGLAAFGGRLGVYAEGTGWHGVYGVSTAAAGINHGVFGMTSSTTSGAAGVAGIYGTDAVGQELSAGVVGRSSAGRGVFALTNTGCSLIAMRKNTSGGTTAEFDVGCDDGIAARLWGDTYVHAYGGHAGNLNVAGTLTKAGGSFKIDHPLDPENKYLSHSFIESPDMMNVYNGVVELGSDGSAVVKLPTYFQALNKDFRYQLTALGMPQPRLHVALKIANNEFMIAGGEPYAEVSWQVTGIRHDRWANANRIPGEVAKPDAEKGLYLHPELYGQGPEKNVSTGMVESGKSRGEDGGERKRQK